MKLESILTNKLLFNLFEHFSTDMQMFKLCEELSELLAVVLKILSEKRNFQFDEKLHKKFIEEIVDVEIMISQMKFIVNEDYYKDRVRKKKSDIEKILSGESE